MKLPSPDLAAEPAVARLQQWMLPIAAIVAVFGVIVAGGKMALTRKANPLIDAGSGLVTIAATSAVGVLLPTLLLQAGDAWSNWVLHASTGGQFGARLTGLLSMTGLAAPAVVVVLGIVAIIISALQAMLMLFRQGALVVLAGALPLAAAGTLTPATRPWFKKVTGWMLALIFYKPAAAAVYAAAFTMIGTGKNVTTILAGFAMVGLSLLALPVLMRFFTWTAGAGRRTPAAAGSCRPRCPARSRSAPCAAISGGLGGASAADQARQQSQRLGPADGGAVRRPGSRGRDRARPRRRRRGGRRARARPARPPAGRRRDRPARRRPRRPGRRAAGGPWAAAAGVAAGAVGKGANAAAGAMQPPRGQQGDSDERRPGPGAAGLRRLAAAPRHRPVRPRAGRDRRRARRACWC